MERNIRSVVEEIRAYYRAITDVQALTALQRRNYEADTRRTLEAQGISYRLDYGDGESDGYAALSLTMPHIDVADVGIIEDVTEKGPSPIRLRIESVEIHYEPRNLQRLNDNVRKEISNAEFLCLTKGSSYQFRGELTTCTYYYRRTARGVIGARQPEFVLSVVGHGESLTVSGIDKQNIDKATSSGILGSLIGAVAGFVGGLVIRIALSLVILPLYSWRKYGLGSPDDHSHWPIVVMISSVIIGAVAGYRIGYSETRQEVLRKE